MGIYRDGMLGRFQRAETHPDFRRRGICGTLVHFAAQYAFERLGAHTLVIVAEEGAPAANIYASVGLQPVEKQVELERVGRTSDNSHHC